jgi:long-chain acyl-CoA synthetase
VFPRELEELLFAVPGVAAAAVVGRPDPEAGELPVAYVVRRADHAGAALTAAGVLAAVNEQVPPYKRLRDVVFVDALPVSPAGKVLKRELSARERAAGATTS